MYIFFKLLSKAVALKHWWSTGYNLSMDVVKENTSINADATKSQAPMRLPQWLKQNKTKAKATKKLSQWLEKEVLIPFAKKHVAQIVANVFRRAFNIYDFRHCLYKKLCILFGTSWSANATRFE